MAYQVDTIALRNLIPQQRRTPPISNNSESKRLGKIVQINDARIQDHLGELVRGTMEETLNAKLSAEADDMFGTQRYECCLDRVDTRAGHHERAFHSKSTISSTSNAA